MSRPQTIAVLSAALLVALLGLVLLAVLVALDADRVLAQSAMSAMHGQMRLDDVMQAMSHGHLIAQRYLAK